MVHAAAGSSVLAGMVAVRGVWHVRCEDGERQHRTAVTRASECGLERKGKSSCSPPALRLAPRSLGSNVQRHTLSHCLTDWLTHNLTTPQALNARVGGPAIWPYYGNQVLTFVLTKLAPWLPGAISLFTWRISASR